MNVTLLARITVLVLGQADDFLGANRPDKAREILHNFSQALSDHVEDRKKILALSELAGGLEERR
jgi:hypothetical protein